MKHSDPSHRGPIRTKAGKAIAPAILVAGLCLAASPEPPPAAGAVPAAAVEAWAELFAGEPWYKQQAGGEIVFAGILEALKSDVPTTLMRTAHYRVGQRTLYTGAGRHPALDARVGKLVQIRGKAVDMELEGHSVREIWPAAVRLAPPGTAPSPEEKPIPRGGASAI